MGSLTDVAELVNFDYTGESRAEIIAIDDDSSMILFANVQENTNFLIEVES